MNIRPVEGNSRRVSSICPSSSAPSCPQEKPKRRFSGGESVSSCDGVPVLRVLLALHRVAAVLAKQTVQLQFCHFFSLVAGLGIHGQRGVIAVVLAHRIQCVHHCGHLLRLGLFVGGVFAGLAAAGLVRRIRRGRAGGPTGCQKQQRHCSCKDRCRPSFPKLHLWFLAFFLWERVAPQFHLTLCCGALSMGRCAKLCQKVSAKRAKAGTF